MLQQNTTNRWLQQQTFISHKSGDQIVQDLVPGELVPGEDPLLAVDGYYLAGSAQA